MAWEHDFPAILPASLFCFTAVTGVEVRGQKDEREGERSGWKQDTLRV